MGDASAQEFHQAEVKGKISTPTAEIKNDIAKPETETSKKATFGCIEIEEDLKTDLLTPHEKKLYMGGFSILKDVVNASENNVARMVLTDPEISSGVVGLQPLVSMHTGEAILLYQAYKHAGIDFNQDYSFLEFGKERDYLKMFVNDRATENTLRSYQKELGIVLPDRVLQKDEILSYTTQLLSSTDVKKANLAHGLLSGFPFEDCQHWINDSWTAEAVNGIPPLKRVEDLDSRFLQETPIPGSTKVFKIDPISLLNATDYETESTRNHFLPDTRASISADATRGTIEGFGLRWAVQLPPRESTIKHAQKILQINRETGLLDFVDQQRGTFNVADNIKAINIGRELLNKSTAKLGGVGGAISLAFGIFSLFAKVMEKTVKPSMAPPTEQSQK